MTVLDRWPQSKPQCSAVPHRSTRWPRPPHPRCTSASMSAMPCAPAAQRSGLAAAPGMTPTLLRPRPASRLTVLWAWGRVTDVPATAHGTPWRQDGRSAPQALLTLLSRCLPATDQHHGPASPCARCLLCAHAHAVRRGPRCACSWRGGEAAHRVKRVAKKKRKTASTPKRSCIPMKTSAMMFSISSSFNTYV